MRVNRSVRQPMQPAAWISALGMLAHVMAMCGTAYWISTLWIEVVGILLYHAGWTWTDAALLASMAGFLVGLVALLWIFSQRVLRAWFAVAWLLGLSVLVVWGATTWR